MENSIQKSHGAAVTWQLWHGHSYLPCPTSNTSPGFCSSGVGNNQMLYKAHVLNCQYHMRSSLLSSIQQCLHQQVFCYIYTASNSEFFHQTTFNLTTLYGTSCSLQMPEGHMYPCIFRKGWKTFAGRHLDPRLKWRCSLVFPRKDCNPCTT